MTIASSVPAATAVTAAIASVARRRALSVTSPAAAATGGLSSSATSSGVRGGMQGQKKDRIGDGESILFSKFEVSKQVFYKTPLSFGLVNLKPLLPGHLSPAEVSDLFLSVQAVGKVVEKAFDAEALTVGCQDGASAGQSVPHVHVHLIPRRSTDFDGDNDRVYPAMETSEKGLKRDLQGREASGGAGQAGGGGGLNVPSDDERRPRSAEEMEKEAKWLAGFF